MTKEELPKELWPPLYFRGDSLSFIPFDAEDPEKDRLRTEEDDFGGVEVGGIFIYVLPSDVEVVAFLNGLLSHPGHDEDSYTWAVKGQSFLLLDRDSGVNEIECYRFV